MSLHENLAPALMGKNSMDEPGNHHEIQGDKEVCNIFSNRGV